MAQWASWPIGQLKPLKAVSKDLSELLLLEIDPDLVDADIIEEPPAPGAEELFPHIYGPLPIAAVRSVRKWTKSETGWQLPDQGPENATALSEPFSA